MTNNDMAPEELYLDLFSDLSPDAELLQPGEDESFFLPEVIVTSFVSTVVLSFLKGFFGTIGKTAANKVKDLVFGKASLSHAEPEVVVAILKEHLPTIQKHPERFAAAKEVVEKQLLSLGISEAKARFIAARTISLVSAKTSVVVEQKSVALRCPNCQIALRIREGAQKIRCPTCRHVFPASVRSKTPSQFPNVKRLVDMDPPDPAWELAYFSQFRVLLSRDNPDRASEWGLFFTSLESDNHDLFLHHDISAATYSRLLYLRVLFLQCCQPANWNEDLVYHMVGHLFEMASTEDHIKEQIRHTSEDWENYTKPRLGELLDLLNIDLIRYNMTGVLKQLAKYVYFSYRKPFQSLMDHSTSRTLWIKNVAETVPLLLVRHCLPLYDLTEPDGDNRGRIVLDQEMGAKYVYPAREISGLYSSLFSDAQIHAIVDEEKVISEVFAKLFSLIVANGFGDLNSCKEEVLELAKREGRLRAKQRALCLFSGPPLPNRPGICKILGS